MNFPSVTLFLSCSVAVSVAILPEYNPDTVTVGLLDINNVIIHVAQNFFNFFVSSLGWIILIPFVQPKVNAVAKDGREYPDEARKSTRDKLKPIKTMSAILRFAADASEQVSRFMDEL